MVWGTRAGFPKTPPRPKAPLDGLLALKLCTSLGLAEEDMGD